MEIKILPDTNFYGLIIIDSARKEIHEAIHKSSFLIFGFDVIRQELRNTSKSSSNLNRNLRIDLLNIYDDLVQKNYSLNDKISKLAEDYFRVYREFGGNISKEKMIPDFTIVACATIKQMDILISDDKHSLLTENSLKTYKLVNELKGLVMPRFISYQEFKSIIMR